MTVMPKPSRFYITSSLPETLNDISAYPFRVIMRLFNSNCEESFLLQDRTLEENRPRLPVFRTTENMHRYGIL